MTAMENDRFLFGVGRHRIVSFAGLYLHGPILGTDLEPPEAAVFSFVGRGEPYRILAAHLLLNLVEDVVQRILAVHPQQPASRIVRHLPEVSVARAHSEAHVTEIRG